MPEICRFLGIVIYMLYDDHRPPHFHTDYGEYWIRVNINTGIVDGKFPRECFLPFRTAVEVLTNR
jgi:hypothetical protein